MTAPAARSRAKRAYTLRFLVGLILYAVGLSLSGAVDGSAVPAWLPALLVLPAVILMGWANVGLYRSGDELQRRKVAEAVMFAFVISAGATLAVGVLQQTVLPPLNWIFAFSILMVSWLLGTLLSAVRYR